MLRRKTCYWIPEYSVAIKYHVNERYDFSKYPNNQIVRKDKGNDVVINIPEINTT